MDNVTDIKKADQEKEKSINIKLNEAERLAIRGLLQQIGNLQNQLTTICNSIAESKGEKLDSEINWQIDREVLILIGLKLKQHNG